MQTRPQHIVPRKKSQLKRRSEETAKKRCYTEKLSGHGSRDMPTTTLESDSLSAREFAELLIAGLAAQGTSYVTASQAQLHRAFRHILAEVSKNERIKVEDLSDVDYDPLYGLSGWLDEFLARAQRDLFISSPNPSYQRIQIKITSQEAQKRLAQYNNEQELKNLSNLFLAKLRS